jgi:hypothetical protein
MIVFDRSVTICDGNKARVPAPNVAPSAAITDFLPKFAACPDRIIPCRTAKNVANMDLGKRTGQ